MNAKISLYSDGAFKYCFTKQGCVLQRIVCFYFFGSGYLLYIVHTDKLPLLSIGKLHLFYYDSFSQTLLGSCKCPIWSLQKGSTGFEEMDHFFFFCGNYWPRLGLFNEQRYREQRPLHYHEALSVPYTSSPENCSEGVWRRKVTAADPVCKISSRSGWVACHFCDFGTSPFHICAAYTLYTV